METNKQEIEEYYTPEQEELFIGYECQRRVIKPNYVEKHLYKWNDWSVDEYYFGIGYEEGQDWNYDEVELRTKFLTKEQIEAEGWKIGYEAPEFYEIFGEGSFGAYKLVNKRDYSLRYSVKTRSLYLRFYAQDETWVNVYNGECKSINEFRKLSKWLGI